jgi:hypothetical protein
MEHKGGAQILAGRTAKPGAYGHDDTDGFDIAGVTDVADGDAWCGGN